MVLDEINRTGIKISLKQSAQLKRLSMAHELSEEKVRELLVMTKKRKNVRKITIDESLIDSIFSDDYSKEDIEIIITELLKKWKGETRS